MNHQPQAGSIEEEQMNSNAGANLARKRITIAGGRR
jgi:hypothetical protein